MNAQDFKKRVKDANRLLNFMLVDRPALVGEKEAVTVPDEVIGAIVEMDYPAQGLADVSPESKSTNKDGDDDTNLKRVLSLRPKFEAAYQRLAHLANPVTAATLDATEPTTNPAGPSPATRWSRKLWVITIATVLFALLGDMLPEYVSNFAGPPDDDQTHWWGNLLYFVSGLLNRLTPFTYGCFGACVYLLRSVHQFIYRREFDMRRSSEHLNRMLLGAVSGGAAAMVITHVTSDGSAVTSLGAPTVGFLAGYNTDLLFTSLERIISAILPKRDEAKPLRGASQAPEPASLPMLIQALKEAKDDKDKELIRDIIKKVQAGV